MVAVSSQEFKGGRKGKSSLYLYKSYFSDSETEHTYRWIRSIWKSTALELSNITFFLSYIKSKNVICGNFELDSVIVTLDCCKRYNSQIQKHFFQHDQNIMKLIKLFFFFKILKLFPVSSEYSPNRNFLRLSQESLFKIKSLSTTVIICVAKQIDCFIIY